MLIPKIHFNIIHVSQVGYPYRVFPTAAYFFITPACYMLQTSELIHFYIYIALPECIDWSIEVL